MGPPHHCEGKGDPEKQGPGFCSPKSAIQHGHHEKILYIPCISTDPEKDDYLSVVDADPKSKEYGTVIYRMKFPRGADGGRDEVHHSGWNTCSSCFDPNVKRDKLLFPCLLSDRVHIVDVGNETVPKLQKTIEAEELHAFGVSTPHTTHCLPNGEVMISTMGDGPEGNAKGQLLLLDGSNDFKVKGTWSEHSTPFGYDFWYQPKFDVMITSEWGAPKSFKKGLDLSVLSTSYGHSLNVWSWKQKKLLDTIDLGTDSGWMPLETRFLHDPNQPHGFVGCALSSTVYHIHQSQCGSKWVADKVISVPPKQVKDWAVGLEQMPGVITDILVSMDDKYLYFSNWVHGDIRQYDIRDPSNPKLTGQVWIGGSIVAGGAVTVVNDSELESQPPALVVKGVTVQGGPQMLQLSLDGKRLYVTTSLFSPWDKQFYPNMEKTGSCLIQVDVNVEEGGMSVNPNFLVDYGQEPEGPVLAHEIRYPGGDCSSDIFMPCQK